MKIGITERGDAGIDLTWIPKLKTVDGAILITKNITDKFTNAVLENCKTTPIIVHCTCTGWGNTIIEPNVPDYNTQLQRLSDLIQKGFPAQNTVLRIDPIFPTENGIKRIQKVIENRPHNVNRIRVSIVDEYRHIKERYRNLAIKYNNPNIKPIYGNNFQASEKQLIMVANALSKYSNITFETCAEDTLAKYASNIVPTGCISQKDLKIMNLNIANAPITENIQNRKGCHCISCKTELLENRTRCPHQCIYCYWKD